MSFDTIEISRDDGRPVFLYQFVLVDTVWRYTSANKDVQYNGFTWTAVPISDDGIKQSGESTQDTLNLTAPTTIGPAQMAFTTPPSAPILLTILHAHQGDPEAVAVYSGQVKQVNFLQPGQCRILCETTSASMQRDGLRLAWQRGCSYSLYDPITCKVDKTAYAVSLRVLSIDGFTVTTDAAGAQADSYFAGGFIQWTDPVRGPLRRGIEAHAGNDFTMFGMTDDLYPGLVVTAYPGCSRTVSTCSTKFNNLDNYGGVPNMPGKSPFDGTPVF